MLPLARSRLSRSTRRCRAPSVTQSTPARASWMIGESRFHDNRNELAVDSTFKENSPNLLGRAWAGCAIVGVVAGGVIAAAVAGCKTLRITNAHTIKIDINTAAEERRIQRRALRRNCHGAD